MLKKIFLVLSVIALIVSYGLILIPVDYKFGEEEQPGLAGVLVGSNISNFSLCVLDVYSMEKTTDLTFANVKEKTTVQFNNNLTAKVTKKYELVDKDTGEVKEDTEGILETYGIVDREYVVYYRVINRKIYMSDSLETVAMSEDAYSYHIENFFTIKEKGDTTPYTSNVAVGFTVIFVGTLIASLVFFAIKKPEEK